MPTKIKITAGSVVLEAELSDTETAKAIAEALPVRTRFSTWGDEFYFPVPVSEKLDSTATTDIKVGDIGYWVQGQSMCIFFGPTPMSKGPDPVPADAVNVIGKVLSDSTLLKQALNAAEILIENA